jgi:hypothetical protein
MNYILSTPSPSAPRPSFLLDLPWSKSWWRLSTRPQWVPACLQGDRAQLGCTECAVWDVCVCGGSGLATELS